MMTRKRHYVIGYLVILSILMVGVGSSLIPGFKFVRASFEAEDRDARRVVLNNVAYYGYKHDGHLPKSWIQFNHWLAHNSRVHPSFDDENEYAEEEFDLNWGASKDDALRAGQPLIRVKLRIPGDHASDLERYLADTPAWFGRIPSDVRDLWSEPIEQPAQERK